MADKDNKSKLTYHVWDKDNNEYDIPDEVVQQRGMDNFAKDFEGGYITMFDDKKQKVDVPIEDVGEYRKQGYMWYDTSGNATPINEVGKKPSPSKEKEQSQYPQEMKRGELKKPSLISQALGMMPKVDAGNIGREQKVGGMIANLLLGDNMQVQQPAQKEASPESKEAAPVTTPTGVVNNEGLMDAKLANYIENWKQRPDKQSTYFENMVADLLADGTANSNEEAVNMVMPALRRYANRSAMDVTNQVVSSLPDDTVQDAEQSIGAQWYSHGVQDKLKQEADSMGISYDDYVGQFLKPAMVQSLVNKYGPNYRNIAEGIATRLYSHDENVQDRLMNQDINEALSSVISKYVNPSVVDEYNKAQEAGSKAFAEGMEGSQFIPANLRLGTALGAQYEANEAKDPAKVLFGLQQKFGKLYRNPKFLNDMSNAAFKVMQRYGLNGTLSSDPKQFKPMINAAIKNELDQLEIKGMMPKGSAEYIMKTGLGNTIVGKIIRKAVQTDYQNWLEDIANQQYQPGFWENVASGSLTFAGDAWSYWLPGAAGGKLTKSMVAKAEGKLAGDLMAKGMERKMAERAAKVLIGKSKAEALKSGAVHGAVTFGGQSAISKPIDEVYRTGQFDENGKIYNPSVGKVIADTLGEVAKQTAVGAIMQGGTIANMVGKGRGLATNILADIGGKVVDSGIMTGHQMLERMAQDPNFKPTGKDAAESFLESMANLTAIGLPGMVGKYARFKDAREFNKKFDFTDQDIAELKRFGYDGLRDAFEKVGIGEYAVVGENAQRLDGQLTQKYMDLMNDKSVPEVLKAKMMAVVEGKRPSSFSPIVDSIIVQPMDHDGKVYLETLNKDGGIIDRKEFSSLDEAQKADKKLEYEKTLGLASVLEGEFHNEFTQEHLEGLYNKAAQKYNMGEKLTDEDKAAVYLHQNAGAIKDIMDKQQKGIILTDEEQKQVNAYRHYYDSALENSSVMREFVNTFEDSHGVARGTLRKALESKDKKYAPLVESYLKELYNSIELKREMKQTMDDLYNTAHGNEQKRIEQGGVEGEKPTAPVEGSAGGQEPPVSEGPSPYQGNTEVSSGQGEGVSTANSDNSSADVITSDAFVMGQNAYKNGDSEALQAIGYNSDLATGRLKRAFADNEKMPDIVANAYNEGRDMEQFVAQRASSLTPAQKEAISKYVEAMDAKKGAIDALQHADDGYGEALKQQLWPYQTEDGNIVPATLDSGKQVFLKKDNEYGGAFVVVPDEQGLPTIKQVSKAIIIEKGTPVPLDEYIEKAVAQQKDAKNKQFISQFDGSGLKRGDIVSVSMEEGDEPSDVKIVGYTDDGHVILTDTDIDVNAQIDPKKLESVTKDKFNAWRQNALNVSISAELDAEDAQRAKDDAAKAEADKKQRYANGIVGLSEGQPDYSSKDTDPNVAAEYLQEQFGEDHGKLLNLVNGSRDDIETQLANKKKAAAEYRDWLDVNADLDPEKAQKVENDLALVNEQIADLDARFKNWNAIRNSVMTPDEVKAMKEERKAEIEKAGVDKSSVLPDVDTGVRIPENSELKDKYPTQEAASGYITSERRRVYKMQEETQREIDGVDKILNQYMDGDMELSAEQLRDLNTTKAELANRQNALTADAKALKGKAESLNILYIKERAEQNKKNLEALSPKDRRKELVAKALEKKDMKAIKEIYKDASTDVMDLTPRTLEEFVSERLFPHSLNAESLAQELGSSNFRRGIGSKYDTNKFNYLLANNGEGLTISELAKRVWEDLSGTMESGAGDGLQSTYTDQDIRNTILDMFKTYDSVLDMRNVTLLNRIAAAENELSGEEEWYEQQKEREIFEKQKEIDEYKSYIHDKELSLPSESELDYINGLEFDRMMEIEDREREYKQYVKSILPELADYDDRSNEEGYGGGSSLGNDSSRRGVDEGNSQGEEVGNGEASSESEIGEGSDSGRKGRQETGSMEPGEGSAVRGSHLPQEASFGERLKSAIAETETEPTEAQKKAGNYKKGHLSFGGYDYTVETPKGVTRSGKDEQGKPWSVTMHDTYGYILGKIGVDGDHIDMFINDAADLDSFDGNVCVVDQVNPETGEFDEHKVMYGYPDEAAAITAYAKNYSPGWKGLGKVTSVPKATFDKWLESSDRKTKPFREYAMIQHEEAKKAKEEGEMLGFPAIDKEGEPINNHIIELVKWAKEQGLEIDPTSKLNSYADLFVMCKDDFGICTLVPDEGEDINQVVYFPDSAQVIDQLGKLQEEFNAGRDLKHSSNIDSELTEGVTFYDADTAREFKDFVNKKLEKQNKFHNKLNSKTIEVPEDATEKNPLGSQLDQTNLPFHRDVKEVKPSEMTEAQKVAYDAVSTMLKKAGIPVKVVSNEDMEKVAEAQDNLNLAMLLNQPEMRFKIKTPEEKQAAENAYNFAKELRPDKWKQYAVVNMSNPNKMPEYFEKQELARKERSYYNKLMWGNYKVFNLDKSFEDNVAGLTGSFPSEFDAYKIDEQTNKRNELKRQIKETEDAYNSTGQERNKYQIQLMKEYMDEHGLTSENDIPDDVWSDLNDKAHEKYQDKLDSLFAKYKDLDRQLKAVAEPGVRFLRTYHGSGASFSEFDFDHIGEGEGSQAFGWGGYVTSSKKIGKNYATLMDNDPSRAYYRIQHSNGTRFAKKYPTLESFLHGDKQIAMNDKFTEQEKIDYYNEMKKLAESYHNLYEVDIPDDNGSNYLDWDASIPSSINKDNIIKDILDNIQKQEDEKEDWELESLENDINDSLDWANNGEELYKAISLYLGDKTASKLLASLGYTGIKYKAGRNFGGAEKGDTNYVIFKPEDMKIVDHTKFAQGKGVVYGYTDGKEIVLNQEHLNPNTPIHEYQHLWRTAAKNMNPELIEHGDKLIMQTQLFDDLKKDPNYNHLTDEQICDEAFARLTGEDGAAILEQMAKDAIKENPLDTAKELSVINKLKEWLKKFWYWTLDTFTKWKPEDIKKMTLEDIRNLVLRDLANGVDPRNVKSRMTKEESVEEKIKAVSQQFGVDEADVAMYANAVKKGSTAEAARARANIKRHLLQANEDKISSLKELLKYTVPVNNALKENFGDLDAMIEERVKQVEAQRNAMEAARKRAEEEEAKRQKHLEELSVIPDDQLDKQYMDALAKGDDATAREMLDEAARRKGYDDTESAYQGVGAWAAPGNPGYESDKARRDDWESSGSDVNLEDIALGYAPQPDDYFSHPERYSQNTPHGLESVKAINTAIDAIKNGEKDVKVKVYRAVPTSVKEGKLRNGDWVTPSKKYAEMHGTNRLEGKYRIIEDEVPATQLWWDGNDANEFGFDDGKAYKYKNAKNNRKLNDLVTYDNKGDVIPPSKRFNSRKSDIRFHRVTEPEELDRLNKEKTFRMYSGMQEVDGKLYSPMAAIIDGKRTDATEIGAWMGADERPDLVKGGKFQLVKTDKNPGAGEGPVRAAYNPYMHTSTSMMNDQFSGAYARGNIKVVEWEIPESEKTSGYRAEGAKDAVGLVPWHSGSVNSLLPKDRQRQVMLSRWRKAVRVVPDSEVAESIAEQLEGTGLAIPWNVVTPNQVRELAKLGVPITTMESGKQAPETKEKFMAQMDELKKEFPQAQFVDVKMTKDAFKGWGILKFSFGENGTDVADGNGDSINKNPNKNVITRRIGSREQAQRRVNETLGAAASDRQRSLGATTKEQRTTWNRRSALGYVRRRAEELSSLLTEKDLEEVKGIFVGHGQENYVYRAKYDPTKVIKFNDFGLTDNLFRINEFIDRVNAHNQFQPKDKYTPIGFAYDEKGDFCIVMEQPYLKGTTPTREEITQYLTDHGFKLDMIQISADEVDLGWTNGEFDLWDAEPRNVIKDENGDLHFFDTMIQHTYIPNHKNPLRLSMPSIRTFESQEMKKSADKVKNVANVLGGAEAVTYTSSADVPEEYRVAIELGAKGWYDPTTHTVHVYLPNCEDGNDAQRTVFHEKIGHEGMEVLLGGEDGVRKFANFVYRSVGKDVRGKIIDFANKYDPDWKNPDRMNVGTQEYIAHLAEEGPKTAEDFSLWTKIKHYLIKVLKKLGVRVPGLLNDKDLRYYLMKAGKALHVWDNMPKEKQEAMMKQASNAEIKDALSDGAGKGKPRQKKGESTIQYMKRVQEWRKWQNAREDKEDPEPPMFYDFDKDEAGKKEWAQLNKDWRERHHLVGEEPTGMPIRMENEEDDAYMNRIHEYEKWQEAMKDQEDPMPDMFAYEKKKQEEVKRKYEDWLAKHDLLEQQQADLDLYEGKIYPAETNPKADALEQQVMQDLAEVTSTDVSKEGAAKTVKHAVIHRRKNMEEASADDAIYINDVKNRIEKMADSGAFDKLLSDYKGMPNRAEKLAEAIPYIIEAPRRLRDLAHDLNATDAFDKGHIHIQPDDVEAIQPFVADLIAETAKMHTVLKDDKEVKVYDDPQAVSEVANKLAQAINANHQGEEGFVPIDGTDILSKHVLPLVKQQIVPVGIDYKNLSPEMKAAIDSIRDWYNYTYDWLKDNHTLKEDAGYNADYVNHIWDKEKSDKRSYAMYMENRQRTKSPNEKPRTISTLMEGISVGLVPKTTDITKMMAYYSRSNIEAWVNKTMLQELSGLNVIERNEDGEIVSSDPLLSSTPPFNLEQYKYFEIPGLGPVWVYKGNAKDYTIPNIITGKKILLYRQKSAAKRFGVVFEQYESSPFWETVDTLASSAKKLELGFSGFHAGALTEVYMVQNMVEFGPKKAMANFMKYIFVDTAKNHELPCFANPEDFQEAASHLVKFGATNDYAAADVQNMFDNMRDAMMKVQEKLKDGNGISGTVALATMPLKVATQMLSLINKGMDRALWDFLHDGLKLATYRMRADKTKERAKKKGWTEEELSRALDEDGQFVNDMFGGQHWDILGASHRTLRYAGRVLLSPDWNASTTRHFLALTGYGSIWNEATFENFKQYYQRLKHKELIPEDEGRRSRQISALLCYGIGFMVFYEGIANGINAAFRTLDEEKERKKAEEIRKTNPSYKSMYELAYGDEGMKWYDYLMRGNSLGQQSKIFLGRYADGTEMYIRHGKQFREVPEYLFNHKGELEFPGPMVQRMIGKANPMVRMTLDDINYLSDFQASHADQEIQRKYGKTIGLLYKDALYWAPFLIPSQENKEFKAVDFFFPSSKGFSPWKAQSYFKDFILSGDMEGVVMTYQSCQRNGIDPEAQIKAAIGSVKALESAEISDGVTSLQEASKRFDAAKSIREKKKMRQKIKKFLSQSDYKAFTQKEALDMVQGYLNGDEDLKEMEKAESKYLMKAKAEDVTEDWRIQNVWNGTMETYQEYQRLKDVDKAKANAFKDSKTNKRLFAARKAISAARRKMNKAKKQMDGTNDAAKLVEIRNTRKELLKTLNGME